MANAIPAGVGDTELNTKKKAAKEEVVVQEQQKDVFALPKPQSKVTLPDGTVVENY